VRLESIAVVTYFTKEQLPNQDMDKFIQVGADVLLFALPYADACPTLICKKGILPSMAAVQQSILWVLVDPWRAAIWHRHCDARANLGGGAAMHIRCSVLEPHA
jgi:hypothetical protein